MATTIAAAASIGQGDPLFVSTRARVVAVDASSGWGWLGGACCADGGGAPSLRSAIWLRTKAEKVPRGYSFRKDLRAPAEPASCAALKASSSAAAAWDSAERVVWPRRPLRPSRVSMARTSAWNSAWLSSPSQSERSLMWVWPKPNGVSTWSMRAGQSLPCLWA